MTSKAKTATGAKSKSPVYSAPALEKGFRVIELLAEHPGGLSISEIAQGLGLSMSEIFRMIMVMEQMAWLKRGDGDRYRVTTKVLDLAFKATPAEELVHAAVPHMRELSRAIEQSCHLVIREGERALVVANQQTLGPTGFSVRVGAILQLEATCSGHVLLAFNALDNGMLPAAVERAGATQDALHRVRSRGFEMMKSVRTLGVTDISFPIYAGSGYALAALTVPFLQLIDGTQTVDKVMARLHLQETARKISTDLAGVR
ncbi:IclR family transcriptional regulator [Asticcacaulis sp. EMRT-3]|uniref:IclR family transcriptional regulator n=1 Tax=Asticcacaulis sp. EMRT-3 TaxID=3040349 RepID=UPI0024AFA5CF|nr:IclR family transcriptional regulator [Asticcacaulis sp. EMRT-3]MDI7775082.1 IclR family transcriptional regulator [Asticcacaulis sp. EMRT-3]